MQDILLCLIVHVFLTLCCINYLIIKKQFSFSRCIGKSSKLTNTVLATEQLSNTTACMLELKALYCKEKLKLKLREVEAKEAIAEQLKILILNKINK